MKKAIALIILAAFIPLSYEASLADVPIYREDSTLSPSSRFRPVSRIRISGNDTGLTASGSSAMAGEGVFRSLSELLYANMAAVSAVGEALHLGLSENGIREFLLRGKGEGTPDISGRITVEKKTGDSVYISLPSASGEISILRCSLYPGEGPASSEKQRVLLPGERSLWVERLTGSAHATGDSLTLKIPTRDPAVSLHCRIFGKEDGESLIVLHGGPGFDHRYLLYGEENPFLELAKTYRIIMFDQRACGRSSGSDSVTEISMDRSLEDTEDVMRYLGLDKAHLAGHSWGAVLAMNYAASHPREARSLILIDPAPLTSRKEFSSFRKKRRTVWQSSGFLLEDADQADYWKKLLMPYFRDMERSRGLSATFSGDDIQTMLTNTLRLSKDVGNYGRHSEASKKISCPALIVYGDTNLTSPEYFLELAGEMSSGNPHIELARIPGAGHYPFIEDPAGVLEAIRSFLGMSREERFSPEVSSAIRFADHIKMLASEAGRENGRLIVGIETGSWVPLEQAADTQSVLSAIRRFVERSGRRGAEDNIKVVLGHSETLFHDIAAETPAPEDRVIVIGSEETLTSQKFQTLRDVFLACIDLENSPASGHFDLMRILTAAMDIAFGREGAVSRHSDIEVAFLGDRIIRLTPLTRIDTNEPAKVYRLQIRALATQA